MTALGTDDRDLIKRIAKKDQSAIDVLFARYQLRLGRFMNRMVKNDAIAAELTNEVFMKVWRHAGTFSSRSAVYTWIYRIAHNEAISYLRKRSDEALDEEAVLEIVDTNDTPEVTIQKTDKAAAIRQCLVSLSDEHREVIELVYYQEMSVREVSETVGIPANTVKTRMFHARKYLSKLLQDAGIDRGWP
jgi:RNA polymerase sigma-70 factor (ECF subfamily)